jgi:hypothetical protein
VKSFLQFWQFRFSGKVWGMAIAFTVGLPLLLLLWVALATVVRRMRKDLDFSLLITSDNYKNLKTQQQKLNKIAAGLKKYKKPNTKGVPLPFKGIIAQVIKMVNLTEMYRIALNERLAQLDNGVKGKHLKPIKEDTLWNTRTNAYDYYM